MENSTEGSYQDVKLSQFNQLTTQRIYGHPIPAGDISSSTLSGNSSKSWHAMIPCLCVQDSPDSPCPCEGYKRVFWIEKSSIIRQGNSGRKDHDGKVLTFYDIDVAANIMVESVKSINVKLITNEWVKPDFDLGKFLRDILTTDTNRAGSGSQTGTMAKPISEIAEEEAIKYAIKKLLDWAFTAIDWAKVQEYIRQQQA